ncbi:MAG TPA: SDR family NAD(P)-dependent oxidoreductase [Polyangiaceae bacterium]|nr:SDR family NAD(P)-dependent oxidoreductase [Polyangiaceae bacterium]
MLPRQPTCVLTGAASGLGRAFAMELASRSSRILLSDIDEAGLAETARLVEQRGGAAKTLRCDVSKIEDMRRLHTEATSWLGDVDLLINNAGVAVGGPVGEVPLADWSWIVGINQWGPIYGCHLFVPGMKKRGSGHVLNVASIAAFACGGQMGPYNVTKAAVVALSETLAGELAGTGVGVTVLCPYFFKTNIARSSRSTGAAVATDAVERLMEKSAVQASEVARLAVAACERGKLYVFPHKEAKALVTLKRMLPETMLKTIGPAATKRFAKA